jgi:hypothetical protein
MMLKQRLNFEDFMEDLTYIQMPLFRVAGRGVEIQGIRCVNGQNVVVQAFHDLHLSDEILGIISKTKDEVVKLVQYDLDVWAEQISGIEPWMLNKETEGLFSLNSLHLHEALATHAQEVLKDEGLDCRWGYYEQ